MGRLMRVVQWLRSVVDDEHNVPEVQVDPGGPPVTAANYATPGVDAAPRPDDTAFCARRDGSGRWVVLGYIDSKNGGVAEPGEVIVYSRDAEGEMVAAVSLLADGSGSLANASGMMAIDADGVVTINGVEIDTNGNITAPGEVVAKSGPQQVGLTTHLTPTSAGPTPPTAGT